jgi:hypothetical protein
VVVSIVDESHARQLQKFVASHRGRRSR